MKLYKWVNARKNDHFRVLGAGGDILYDTRKTEKDIPCSMEDLHVFDVVALYDEYPDVCVDTAEGMRETIRNLKACGKELTPYMEEFIAESIPV